MKKRLPCPPRTLVQILFFAIVIHIGILFYLFVSPLEKGIMSGFERPPGVEVFLPISALVSLKHTLFTGTINKIHPAALVLFFIICMTALIAKKSFCSWICPFGLISEILGKLHSCIFRKGLSIPLWTDFILRSLKFVIAGFFIWTIFYKMPIAGIEQFIQSPYNKFADIKMLTFFTRISSTALTIILVLFILSIIIRNFWCRYLCPYGALLGIISFLSIGRIKRNPANCTECGKCEQKCPGLIKIRQKQEIHSSECTACMECMNICPEKNAIGFSLFSGKLPIHPSMLALILILLFTAGISLAKISGNWQNRVSKEEYLRYGIQSRLPWNSNIQIDSPKGIHLCGNPDWDFLLGLDMDILSLDMYSNAQIFAACTHSIKKFLDKGGVLVWGIVPTGIETFEKENLDLLAFKLNGIWKALDKKGIGMDQIINRSMLSPATCCLVNQDKEKTVEKAFRLTKALSRNLREQYKLA